MKIKKKQKIKSYYFGIFAEFIAIIFLFCKGYKILKRRNKTFVGEIDIIAKKGNDLIITEVKARRKWHDQLAEEVLSDYQKFRIKRAAEAFLSMSKGRFNSCGVRFDLVIITPYKLPKHFIDFF